jgi:hypothetical protein
LEERLDEQLYGENESIDFEADFEKLSIKDQDEIWLSNTITATNAITGGSFVSSGGANLSGSITAGTSLSSAHTFNGSSFTVTAPIISLNGYISMGNNWFGQW